MNKNNSKTSVKVLLDPPKATPQSHVTTTSKLPPPPPKSN